MTGRGSIFPRIARKARRLVRSLLCRLKLLFGKTIHVHIENRWRLGDEIMAIPFYSLVKSRFPDSRITVSVNYPGLLSGCDCVEPDNSVGEFDCDMYIFAKDDARSLPRLDHLCGIFSIPYEPLEPAVVPRSDPVEEREVGETLIACSCGAGWPCKSWSPEGVRQLAGLVAERAPHARFVEVGKGCAAAGVGDDWTNKLSIEETAAILSQCDLYVGPDSGLVHLALAVGIPVVGLYGPVDPLRAFGPRARLYPVISPEDCRGCWTDGRMTEPGKCALGIEGNSAENFPCMRSITAETVYASIVEQELLYRRTQEDVAV